MDCAQWPLSVDAEGAIDIPLQTFGHFRLTEVCEPIG